MDLPRCGNQRKILVLVLLLSLVSLVLTTRQYNCTFSIIDKDLVLPKNGECRGPMDYVSAKRKAIKILNDNCPLDKIPISPQTNSFSEKTICGDCVPGTHGNYVFFNQQYSLTVTRDSTTLMKIVDGVSRISQTRFTSSCPFNHYCNSEGKCKHMNTLPNYNSACKVSVAPLSEESLACGGLGLRCVQGRCKICDDNYSVVQPLRSSLPTIDPTQRRFWLPAYCIAGEYVTKDDVRAFWNVYHLECIFFLVLFCCIVAIQCLFSLFKCLSKRKGVERCFRMFSLEHWEQRVDDMIFKPLDEMERQERAEKRKLEIGLVRRRRNAKMDGEQIELEMYYNDRSEHL